MGYYSDVAVAVKTEDYPRFLQLYSDEMGGEKLEEEFNFETEEYNNATIIRFENTKWYDNMFPEVIAVMRTLRSQEFPYKYIRIGEEPGDIEREEFDDNNEIEAFLETKTEVDVWW